MINEGFSMRKSISMLSAVLLLGVGLVPAADALTLSVVPQASTLNVGDTVSVDVVVSDLVNGGAPSLGAYDIDLSFDPSVLSFASIAFGTGLSVTGVPSIIQEFALGTGFVNPFEASLEDTADLNALQAGAFTLFTITFNAGQVGTSLLSLGVNSLSNAEGAGVVADALNAGTISVVGAPAVPLPAGVWLLVSGVAGVGALGRRWRRGGGVAV
jgi:cohesin domain-containing protein